MDPLVAIDPITGIALVDWFLSLLNQYGYFLVFGFTIFENLFVVGSFTPGETVVMAAAFLSNAERGNLNLTAVWITSVIGTITGSNISYWVGRYGGRDTLLKFGRRFHISEKRIEKAEEYFLCHGSKTVFMSRFAAGFKNFVPMIAGVSKMHVGYFEGWTVLGAITYTSIMCAVGYLVGENFDRALSIMRQVGTVGMLLFVLVIVIAVRGRRTLSEKRHSTDSIDDSAKEPIDSADNV